VSVSPADFELYSRVTGTPLPRTAAEQMRLAPQVFNFIRNQQYAQEPNLLQQTAGTLGKLALLGAGGAGLYALSQRRQTPSTESAYTFTPVKRNQNEVLNQSGDGEDAQVEAKAVELTEGAPTQTEVISQNQNPPSVRDAVDQAITKYGSGALQTTQPQKKEPRLISIIRDGKGGDSVRRGGPLLGGAGILTHGIKNLSGGVTNEGGALGKSIRSDIWNTIPGVEPLREGAGRFAGDVGNLFSGTWNAIPGHNLIANAATSGVQAIPGAMETVSNISQGLSTFGNTLGTGGAELLALGGLVAADSAVKDTIYAGTLARKALDPDGTRLPTAIQRDKYYRTKLSNLISSTHDNTLVPAGRALGRRAAADYDRGIIKPFVEQGKRFAGAGLGQWQQQQITGGVDEVGQEHDLNDDPQNPDADQVGSDENRITTQEKIQRGDIWADEPTSDTNTEEKAVTPGEALSYMGKSIVAGISGGDQPTWPGDAQEGPSEPVVSSQRAIDRAEKLISKLNPALEGRGGLSGREMFAELDALQDQEPAARQDFSQDPGSSNYSGGQTFIEVDQAGDLVAGYPVNPGKRYTYPTTSSSAGFSKAVGNLGRVPYDSETSNRAQGLLRAGQDYADPEAVDEYLRRGTEQAEAAENLERGIKSGVFGGDGVSANEVVSRYTPGKKFSGFGQEMEMETGRVSEKTGRALKDREVKKYSGGPDKGSEYVKEFISKRIFGE